MTRPRSLRDYLLTNFFEVCRPRRGSSFKSFVDDPVQLAGYRVDVEPGLFQLCEKLPFLMVATNARRSVGFLGVPGGNAQVSAISAVAVNPRLRLMCGPHRSLARPIASVSFEKSAF